LFGALVLGASVLLAARPAHASVYTVNITQQGSDVVASGSGSFDLTGLTFENSGSTQVEMNPSAGEVGMGDNNGFFDDLYFNNAGFGPGLIGPTFGSGGRFFPSSGTSPDFLLPNDGSLLLPQGYASGTSMTDSSTYTGATLSSLGITPGTYTWTWDSGANSLVLNATVPEPASLAVIGVGIGMMMTRRRRRIS
jgi:hypothetical protein